MESESIYWNPLIETLPPEKLRDLQFMKFKRTLDWVYQNSPFYKKIYKKAGLEPGDIKNTNEIRHIPKIEKSKSGNFVMRWENGMPLSDFISYLCR